MMPAGIAIGLGSLAVAVLLSALAEMIFDLDPRVAAVLPYVSALAFIAFVGMPIFRRIMTGRFKARLARHGVSGPLPAAYEMTSEAFIYAIGGMHRSARWDVVSEVFKVRDWWVLMAQGEACYVPRRIFTNADVERAFITEVVQHLTDAARARSPDAVRLVA